MKQRFLAALLACLLLSGCAETPLYTAEEEVNGPVVAYVPLDDRPDNVERVQYLAWSLGYDLQMPQADDYRTRLQGQPLNENGTQYGDRADLYQWVLEQEESGCDRYILSMDQMLSGGLVNSRSMWEHEAVTLSDGTTLTEPELLSLLLETLARDGNNQVWLLDSVMRLAPTVGYDHWDLDGYNALRSYGMAGRPVLEGQALTVENIEADYRLGSDGSQLSLGEFGLEEWEVEEYLSARSRKLELAGQMMETVTGDGYGNFHVLIGIDDSSEEDSIQKNEIAYLRSLLRQGDALLSGVDDLAFKAVTRLYLDEQGWDGATATVRYYGGTEDQPACAYDYKPLQEIMAEHFDFFDLQESPDGELQILVLTQPLDEAAAQNYCNSLSMDLRRCQIQGQPVIVIDAGNGRYGTMFHEMLTEHTELGGFLSYAGFLDMAIVTGTALSHGVARYARLEAGRPSDAENRAFARTLADSILKDFCYKNIVRDKLLTYIRSDLGANPDNFWQPDTDRNAIRQMLEREMEECTKPVIRNLESSNMAVVPDPAPSGDRIGWGSVLLGNYRFPWDRAFEIGMDIELGAFTSQHKGIYEMYTP